jgi:hypothetical protein
MVLLLSFVFKLELVICAPETFYIYEDGTAFYCLGDGHVTVRHALTIFATVRDGNGSVEKLHPYLWVKFQTRNR